MQKTTLSRLELEKPATRSTTLPPSLHFSFLTTAVNSSTPNSVPLPLAFAFLQNLPRTTLDFSPRALPDPAPPTIHGTTSISTHTPVQAPDKEDIIMTPVINIEAVEDIFKLLKGDWEIAVQVGF